MKKKRKKKKEKRIGEYFRLAFVPYMQLRGRGIQKEIAELLHIQSTYVSDFFTGKKIVSEKIRVQLAKYAGLNFEELIGLGRRIHNKSVVFQDSKKHIIYSDEFPKNMREKLGKTHNVFAKMLRMSETEYIFKEERILAFSDEELNILAGNTYSIIEEKKQQAEKMSELNKRAIELMELQKRVCKNFLKAKAILKKKNII
jgi:plasmid maintenance system antidote protein VapI